MPIDPVVEGVVYGFKPIRVCAICCVGAAPAFTSKVKTDDVQLSAKDAAASSCFNPVADYVEITAELTEELSYTSIQEKLYNQILSEKTMVTHAAKDVSAGEAVAANGALERKVAALEAQLAEAQSQIIGLGGQGLPSNPGTKEHMAAWRAKQEDSFEQESPFPSSNSLL